MTLPKSRMIKLSLLSALILGLAAEGLAQPQFHESQVEAYSEAIRSPIDERWAESPVHGPGLRCAARITQIPGGDILGVDFEPDCDFDHQGRTAVAEAVYLSAPLPYDGFERVFQREIRMVFHPPRADSDQAGVAGRESVIATGARAAEGEPAHGPTTGIAVQEDEYKRRCSFHLVWNMPEVRLNELLAALVTVERSGRVVGVRGTLGQPVSGHLDAALRATSPCKPVSTDLFPDSETVEVGPILIRARRE